MSPWFTERYIGLRAWQIHGVRCADCIDPQFGCNFVLGMLVIVLLCLLTTVAISAATTTTTTATAFAAFGGLRLHLGWRAVG